MLSLLAGELCHVSTERLAIRIDVSTRNAEPAAMRKLADDGQAPGLERSRLFWAKSSGERSTRMSGWSEACIPLLVHAGNFGECSTWNNLPEERGHSSPSNRFWREPKMFHVEHLGSTSSSLFHVKQLASRGSLC